MDKISERIKQSIAENPSFSVVVIGTTSLALECCRRLLNRKHQIRAIFSDDLSFSNWAETQKIPRFPLHGALTSKEKLTCDYLLSIYNPRVLGSEELALARLGALNVHDSILPSLAGVNAPSWAILAGATEHGVTWHEMTCEIDAGTYRAQRTFAVSETETAASLNQKCFVAALSAFDELLADLETGTLRELPALTAPSYRGRYERPLQARLDFRKNAGELARMIRALDFGSGFNPLGLAKLFHQGTWLNLESAQVLKEERSEAQPGTVLSASQNALRVQTGAGVLSLNGVSLLDGTPIAIESEWGRLGIRPGVCLKPFANTTETELERALRRAAKREAQWMDVLQNRASVSSALPFPPESLRRSEDPRALCYLEWCPREAPESLELPYADWVCALIATYTSRFAGLHELALGVARTNARSARFEGLFRSALPIVFERSAEMSLVDAARQIAQKREKVEALGWLSADLAHRLRRANLPAQDACPLQIVLAAEGENWEPCPDARLTLLIHGKSKRCNWLLSGAESQEEGRELLANLVENLDWLAEQAAKQPNLTLDHFSLTCARQKRELEGWNQTRCSFPDQHCLNECFEVIVGRYPERAALVEANLVMDYATLNLKAARLAQKLKLLGLGEEAVVAVLLEKSNAAIIAFWACLKAGLTYHPLDPSQPKARLEGLLEELRPALLLKRSASQTPKHCGQILDWEGLDDLQTGPTLEKSAQQRPRLAAYQITTSGSSGKPKTVRVEHRGAVNLAYAQVEAFAISSESRIWQFAALTFDASISEIVTAHLSGAALYLPPETVKGNPAQLWKALEEAQISHITLPPSLLAALGYPKLPGGLQTLVVAGEHCPLELIRRYADEVRLINAYGPTEITVCATMQRCQAEDPETLIGTPMANTAVYLLDEQLEPVPVGMVGELYLSGVGLARGYVGEEGASAFVANPFYREESGESGTRRMYRTGDLARRLANGALAFVGRGDRQIKLRGYRVELDEIEQVAERHPEVRQAAARSQGSGALQRLCLHAQLEPWSSGLQLWPSTAEFYVYDDLLYGSLTGDQRRNAAYLEALRHAAGKIVVEIGTGKDAILARLAIQAGAAKVYALERNGETAEKARRTVAQLGLSERIEVIHADAMLAKPPVLADIHLSEIVGPIGGCEGAAAIIEATRHWVRRDAQFIPSRSLTRIAAISLPEALVRMPHFDEVPAYYLAKIFAEVGAPFDVRICLKGASPALLLSDEGIFEDLVFDKPLSLEDRHEVDLRVRESGPMHGFLVWLNLFTCPDQVIDILQHPHSWLPVFLPVFPQALSVQAGDQIRFSVTRKLCENGLNPEFELMGGVLRGAEILDRFHYRSQHFRGSFRHNAFYQALFLPDGSCRDAAFVAEKRRSELRNWLAEQLPAYMCPDDLLLETEIPLTRHGKKDYAALAAKAQIKPVTVAPKAPRTPEMQTREWLSSLLDGRDVPLDTPFLELGFHSLLLLKLAKGLSEIWQVPLSPTDFLAYGTPRQLLEQLGKQADSRVIEPPSEAPALSTAQSPPMRGTDIAIIGFSCAFPGAPDADCFWRLLIEGRSGLRDLSSEELASDPLRDAPGFVKRTAPLTGIENFDYEYFGYAPSEAALIDPQQRLLLQQAVLALEHAGIDPQRFGARIGTYVGSGLNYYLMNHLYPNRPLREEVGLFPMIAANDKDFAATRLAFKLGLKGPAVAVQSACSTSLTAIHSAIAALRAGECELALAGAVSLQVPTARGYQSKAGMIHSPTGACRPFDASADGTVLGSGVGLVVLRPYEDARRAGDQIYARIRGSALNNDGERKAGFSAPSFVGQVEVIQKALQEAGWEPSQLDYLETHGTATQLGDAVEMRALHQVFAKEARALPLELGGVKANLGHLDTAAGIAGLIKLIQLMRHRQIPPQIQFERLNPELECPAESFRISKSARAWESAKPIRAGLSSFGIGGTNAHLLLEEAVPDSPTSGCSEQLAWKMFAISAHSLEALRAQCGSLKRWLEARTVRIEAHTAHAEHALLCGAQPDSLADIASTLALGRRQQPWRFCALAKDQGSLSLQLAACESGSIPLVRSLDAPRLLWVFNGQGSQHPQMGAALYRTEPVFRQALERVLALLQPQLDFNLREQLFAAPNDFEAAQADCDRTRFAQPAVFAVQVALAELWSAWGLKPQALAGHSLGELSAAYVAGLFSLEDAARLVCIRARLMEAAPLGAMTAVNLPATRLSAYLFESLQIAAYNGPESVVAAGPIEAIATLEQRLAADGIRFTRMKTRHAFHTPAMAEAERAFRKEFRELRFHEPRLRWVSCATGDWVGPGQAANADFWATQLTQPVRFAEAIQRLLDDGAADLLEIGPGASLQGPLAEIRGTERERCELLASLPHRERLDKEAEHLQRTLARLWQRGHALDWKAGLAQQEGRRIALPGTYFLPHRVWYEPPGQSEERPSSHANETPHEPCFWLAEWTRIEAPPSQGEARAFWVVGPKSPALKALLETGAALGHEIRWLREHELGEVPELTAPQASGLAAFTQSCAPGALREHAFWRTQFRTRAQAPAAGPLCLLFASQLEASEPAAETPENADLQEAQRLLEPLVAACAVLSEFPQVAVQIQVLSQDLISLQEAEPTRPAAALLRGPLLAAPGEIPGLRCRQLDVRFARHDWWRSSRHCRRVFAELTRADAPELLALRADQSYCRNFKRWTPQRSAALGTDGLVWITGGSGGLGLALAQGLAERGFRRFLLTARSPRSASDPAIQALERLGCQLEIHALDVADAPGSARVLAEAETRLGPLRGLIHAAGQPSSGLLATSSPAKWAAVLRAKREGCHVLYELVRERELDFWVNLSSLAALLPDPGQADYASANAYLDAFSLWANQRLDFPVLSIQWDSWREVGMFQRWKEQRESKREGAIKPEQGVEALWALLADPRPLVAFAARCPNPQNPPGPVGEQAREPAARANNPPTGPAQAAPFQARPPESEPAIPARNPTEQRICDIWQHVLGIAPIGIHDDFLALGGHSLLATQVISRLRQEFNIQLALHEVLGKSPAQLAACLSPTHPSETETENFEEGVL